jgi:hypothetical protein
MKSNSILLFLAFALFGTTCLAQQGGEQRVGLQEQAIASDAEGRAALAGRLRTTDLKGALDSPVTNIRLVIENRSPFFYTYVSGWATFYDSDGVRCGEGLFKLDALAVGEAAETDTPGLRLRCTPATWRVVATNLVTRTSDATKPSQPEPAADTSGMAMSVPPLEINIDGETLPLQLGNPIEIGTSQKRSVRIVVNRRQ